jgi:hypothetical protein
MTLIEHHAVDLSPLITHHFSMDDIDAALDLFSHQRDGVLKVALHPGLPRTGGALHLTHAGVAVDDQC